MGSAGASRRRVNDFYAAKKGGDINLCMHIRELCYRKRGRGDQQKNVLQKGRVRRI